MAVPDAGRIRIVRPSAPNTDGHIFTAEDGAKLTVLGRKNALHQSMRDLEQETTAGWVGGTGAVTYNVLKQTCFVLSGKNKFAFFYVKTFVTRNQIKSFESSYPESKAKLYGPTGTHLVACFRSSEHMGVLVPNASTSGTTPVTAYVPKSSWSNFQTGVEVVPIEGSGSPSLIATPDYINSCSTNSITGVSVCTANGSAAKVYILSGTSVTKTLTSASNAKIGFSGGGCYNCGVAVNSVSNQAVITMGYSGAASGLQFLDLNTNTFGPVVKATHEVSEDVLWDPFSNQILSPNEGAIYDIFQITGDGLPAPATVNEASLSTGLGEQDSAGEDCTTGIALAVQEGSGRVFLADLKQAKFTGASWTAPNATYNLPEFASLSAGSSAVAVAPGSTHLGVVAGEFGGNYVGIIQLPATSGSGTPALVDYVLAQLPATPDGRTFANGYDPHTTTAYTSPNSQKAYGLAASWASGSPAYVAVIDLQAMLAAPRTGAHTVSNAVNLLTSGIVRYVKATP